MTLIPHDIEALGVKVHKRVEDAIEGADVIDILRIQLNASRKVCSRLHANMQELFGINGKTPGTGQT